VILCARHNQPDQRIKQAMEQHGPFHTQQQVLDVLKKVYEEYKKERQLQQVYWQRKQLQLSKAAHSNKHR
jgi:hypothetical protein